PAHDLDPVQTWHPDVDEDHIRAVDSRQPERLSAVAGLSLDSQRGVLLEDESQSLPHEWFVLGKDESGRGHGGAHGITALRRQPPSHGPASTHPPSRASRSCSPRFPVPDPSRRGGRGGPLSRTTTTTCPSSRLTATLARRASLCRTTLVSASWTTRYTVVETLGGTSFGRSTRIPTSRSLRRTSSTR